MTNNPSGSSRSNRSSIPLKAHGLTSSTGQFLGKAAKSKTQDLRPKKKTTRVVVNGVSTDPVTEPVRSVTKREAIAAARARVAADKIRGVRTDERIVRLSRKTS